MIVLGVVGLLLFHPWSGSHVQPTPVQPKPVQPRPQATEKPSQTPVATPEPTVSTVPQAPPAPPPVEDSHPTPQPPKVKPSSTKKQPVTAKDTGKTKKPADTPIQGFEGNSTYDGMTPKDIPRLLQWARADAGNGNYVKAAQEYRVILELQPSNPDAREGLRKIQLAQQGRDQ